MGGAMNPDMLLLRCVTLPISPDVTVRWCVLVTRNIALMSVLSVWPTLITRNLHLKLVIVCRLWTTTLVPMLCVVLTSRPLNGRMMTLLLAPRMTVRYLVRITVMCRLSAKVGFPLWPTVMLTISWLISVTVCLTTLIRFSAMGLKAFGQRLTCTRGLAYGDATWKVGNVVSGKCCVVVNLSSLLRLRWLVFSPWLKVFRGGWIWCC